MNIAFVWDWEPNIEFAVHWKDGLAAALRELSKRHSVDVYTDIYTPIAHDYFEISGIYRLEYEAKYADVICVWGDMSRPHIRELAEYGKPLVNMFAGGELFTKNTDLFDHIFVESQVYLDQFLERGYSASLAFGTNTEMFKPLPGRTHKLEGQRKVFDVFFPGAYAAWKRHKLLAEALNPDFLVCTAGVSQKIEKECYQDMQDIGALVLPFVGPEALNVLYNSARTVVVPSHSEGGSQRTVLEAMACNVPVIATDSDKFDAMEDYGYTVNPDPESIHDAIKFALGEEPEDTRSYIEQEWSHITYANKIEEELCRLVS